MDHPRRVTRDHCSREHYKRSLQTLNYAWGKYGQRHPSYGARAVGEDDRGLASHSRLGLDSVGDVLMLGQL